MLRTEESHQLPQVELGRSALLLDIDGTLLDIAATPRAVVVPPKLVVAIGGLTRRMAGAIAFVSGRALADIDALFSPLKLPAIGCHGAQFRSDPTGRTETAPAIPDEVREWTKSIVSEVAGLAVDDKRFALSIHYRLAPEALPVVLKALAERQDQFREAGLEAIHGKMVIDIKWRRFSKGTALARLMGYAPFLGRTPIFLGDDKTDEDAFGVLPKFAGRGFSVGRAIEGAAYTFKSPHAVRRWLIALEDAAK